MKVLEFNPVQAVDFKHRKENKFTESYILVAFDGGEFKEVIDLRVYNTDSRNYVCVWIRHNGKFASGSGWAQGYGYHRPSAAAAEALLKAGVKLDTSISGVGDSAVRDALTAIAVYLGYKNYHIVKAHG